MGRRIKEMRLTMPTSQQSLQSCELEPESESQLLWTELVSSIGEQFLEIPG